MKFKVVIKVIIHLLLFILLTILSQIGGIIYILSFLVVSNNRSKYKLKRMFFFLTLYFTFTFLIVPNIAPFFGRVKIEGSNRIKAHSFITLLFNRNYVTPKMKSVLNDISLKVYKDLPGSKLIYLDANFPFFDGFPLLPHLSHNDGKKIDISFIYEDKDRKISNLKPSISGYGIFEKPRKGEINQSLICKQNGFWHYDFTKHLTLGSSSKDLKFSKSATRTLINNILSNATVSKVFIEPHLKNRLNLTNSKIRFQGCRAVRHDDHIHFQIR